MSKYKGLFTFDVENHRYLPVEQADGLIAEMDYHPEPTEPLIKDEKIRKAVRAWAEACEIDPDDAIMISGLAPAFTRFYTSMFEIDIKTESSLGLDEHRDYTIAELCGEREE